MKQKMTIMYVCRNSSVYRIWLTLHEKINWKAFYAKGTFKDVEFIR